MSRPKGLPRIIRTQDEIYALILENSIRNPETNCLLWYGVCTSRGYGWLPYSKTNRSLHRFVYKYFHKCELTREDIIMHECDIKNCCEITHLKKGTHQQNVADAIKRGHFAYRRDEKKKDKVQW